MVTSIEKLLETNHTNLEDSVYSKLEKEILQYPITIGDFVDLVDGEKVTQQFHTLCVDQKAEKEIFRQSKAYTDCENRLKEINGLLKKRKKQKDFSLTEEELEAVRLERKELMKKKKQLSVCLEKMTEEQLGYVWQKRKVLRYKSTVCLSEIGDIKKRLPVLEDLELPSVEQVPLFVSNLERLSEALADKEEIGIVGGPCLFGLDEVFIHLVMQDGQRVSFDCSCGRRCLNENKTDATLEEFILAEQVNIRSAIIENRKAGITRQEKDSILNLFAFADSLHARAVIPLPDISYLKYMESDIRGLPEKMRQETLERFRQECYSISDMYLRWIEDISSRYPQVEYQVLHARNEKLCRLFYEKRAPYIQNSSYIQKITNVSGKKDAVIDYITMLALPFYIYGTRTVVQLDSVDETDSGRKCNKIHKKDLDLTQILYPEYLSRDGKNTIYYAPAEYKDYLESI